MPSIEADRYRPIYHFNSPRGHAVPFDPNGAIFWKGKYHLGYIYQREVHGESRHVWGHAVSTDLLDWTIYPDMLTVEIGDVERGIFSGGAFISREGVPHLIYHAWGAQANRLAYASDDDLKTWVKVDEPALVESNVGDPKELICCHPPLGPYSVFDPDAWYDSEADCYYQITGGMKPGLFESGDLRSWRFVGSLIDSGNAMREWYEDLSCPAFFRLGGDKAMILFISHERGAQYYLGTFTSGKFEVERHGRMNWPGGSLFAPEQLQDADGRNIFWGWIAPYKRPSHLPDPGWSGTMSLPRILSLDISGELRIEPAEELKLLRLSEVRENAQTIMPHDEATLQMRGSSIELEMELLGGDGAPFGVKVFVSPDGREETVIRYEPARKELVIEFGKSSVSCRASVPVFDSDNYDFSRSPFDNEFWSTAVSEQRAPFELQEGEALKLRIFLDRSLVEVFANGRLAMTQVVFPELPNSTGVTVYSGGETVIVKNAISWTMAETKIAFLADL